MLRLSEEVKLLELLRDAANVLGRKDKTKGRTYEDSHQDEQCPRLAWFDTHVSHILHIQIRN